MPQIQESIIYESDGRHAAWHLPFPFLRPSDIGAIIIAPDGLEIEKKPNFDFIVYWDFIVCVVPAGYRIKLFLKRPIDVILQELAKLELHKVKNANIENGSFADYAEQQDGVYLNLHLDDGTEMQVRDDFNPVTQTKHDVISIGDRMYLDAFRPVCHGIPAPIHSHCHPAHCGPCAPCRPFTYHKPQQFPLYPDCPQGKPHCFDADFPSQLKEGEK